MLEESRYHHSEHLKLPGNWSQSVRNAMLNVLGILRIAMLDGRKLLIEQGRAPEAQVQRLRAEVAMVNSEHRIVKDQVVGDGVFGRVACFWARCLQYHP